MECEDIKNKLKKEIIDYVVKQHEHHEGKRCPDYNFPYVNSLELVDFIKSL